jgi:6,7-dimethyl-8-ribityllumazine synthase
MEKVIPITHAILTVENLEQALHRSGGKLGNKGKEAARALIELLRLP